MATSTDTKDTERTYDGYEVSAERTPGIKEAILNGPTVTTERFLRIGEDIYKMAQEANEDILVPRNMGQSFEEPEGRLAISMTGGLDLQKYKELKDRVEQRGPGDLDDCEWLAYEAVKDGKLHPGSNPGNPLQYQQGALFHFSTEEESEVSKGSKVAGEVKYEMAEGKNYPVIEALFRIGRELPPEFTSYLEEELEEWENQSFLYTREDY